MGKPGKSNAVTTVLEQPPAALVGGRRTISAVLEYTFWFQLKQISIDRDIPMRSLMQEAFNDFFVKYGKEQVASHGKAHGGDELRNSEAVRRAV